MSPHPLLPLVYKSIGHFAFVSGIMGVILATDVNFRSQITLGSVIVGVLILVFAGTITVRSKIANIWREEAEGERAAKERLQEELTAEKLARTQFEKEQQEIRHDLKDKIAGYKAQIQVLEAKTDLTVALDAIRAVSITQTEGHHRTHQLLEAIRDKMPDEPVSRSEPLTIKEPISVHVEQPVAVEQPLEVRQAEKPVEVHEVEEKKEVTDPGDTANN